MSLIPYSIENYFDHMLDLVIWKISRSGIRPNWISTVGFMVILVAAFLLFKGEFSLAGVLILFGGLLDMADGKLARLTRQESIYGAIYDSTVDRIGELAIYTGIGAYLVANNMHMIAFVAVIAVGGSILISYIRARAESYDIPCNVGLLRRGERILLFGMGATLNFLGDLFHEPVRWMIAPLNVQYLFPPMPLTIVLIAIAILSPVTIAQRLIYIKAHESIGH